MGVMTVMGGAPFHGTPAGSMTVFPQAYPPDVIEDLAAGRRVLRAAALAPPYADDGNFVKAVVLIAMTPGRPEEGACECVQEWVDTHKTVHQELSRYRLTLTLNDRALPTKSNPGTYDGIGQICLNVYLWRSHQVFC